MKREMKRLIALSLVVVFAASGCVAATGPPRPTLSALPGTGQPITKFRSDEQACRDLATSQVGDPAEIAQDQEVGSAIAGTLLGAFFGGLLGAGIGGKRGIGTGLALGAGAGLSTGAVAGAVSGEAAGDTAQARWDNEYWTCMYEKGHKVPSGQPITERTPQPSMPSIPPPPPPPALRR